MATHSSVLAWRIPGTGEPGGRPSMGSHRVDTTERLHFSLYNLETNTQVFTQWKDIVFVICFKILRGR